MRSSLRFLGENIRKTIVQANNGQAIGKTVYLTHVKWVTGKHQLQNYFSRYGQVRSVNMFFDAETGLHRGFASVTFEHPESATRAMQQRPHVIDGDRRTPDKAAHVFALRKVHNVRTADGDGHVVFKESLQHLL